MSNRTNENAFASSSAPRGRTASAQEFTVADCAFRWIEGTVANDNVKVRGPAASRESTRALFARSVVPGLERRGARGLVYSAAVPSHLDPRDARWVAWRAAGDEAPSWGLYVARSCFPDATGDAANDAFVLIAWGDGPVLAWADSRDLSHVVLRTALRTPPSWFALGFRSNDPSFAVRISVVRRGRRSVPLAAPLAQSRPRERALPHVPASREALLQIVQDWKRALRSASTR